MALCDGMMDAAILRRYETQRPETSALDRMGPAAEGQGRTGLGALEQEATTFGDRVDIGTLTVAIMLDYLDFRFGGGLAPMRIRTSPSGTRPSASGLAEGDDAARLS